MYGTPSPTQWKIILSHYENPMDPFPRPQMRTYSPMLRYGWITPECDGMVQLTHRAIDMATKLEKQIKANDPTTAEELIKAWRTAHPDYDPPVRRELPPEAWHTLRRLAGNMSVGDVDPHVLDMLEQHRLIYRSGDHVELMPAGERWLKRHIIRGDHVEECEPRSTVVKQTVKKQYGLADRMIDRFLPAPMEAPNPYYRSGPPMKLWFVEEVAAAVESPEVRAELEKSAERREKSRKTALAMNARKRAETTAMVSERIKQIKVKRIPLGKLKSAAIRSREDWYEETEQWDRLDGARSAPEDVKQRWMVNYVRHHLTEYDETLWDLAGHVGCHEQYERYRSAVMAKIAEVYPVLAGAVARAEAFRLSF